MNTGQEAVDAIGWYCSAAGKVTAGLVSYRPCIIDCSIFTDSMAYGRETSTPPTLI